MSRSIVGNPEPLPVQELLARGVCWHSRLRRPQGKDFGTNVHEHINGFVCTSTQGRAKHSLNNGLEYKASLCRATSDAGVRLDLHKAKQILLQSFCDEIVSDGFE